MTTDGLIDPIEDIAALAAERGIGMHVDGCLGGLLWPWAEELGYDIPLWDFVSPASHRSPRTRTSTAIRSRARPRCSTATRTCDAISTSRTRIGPVASTCPRTGGFALGRFDRGHLGSDGHHRASGDTWMPHAESWRPRPPSAPGSTT